MKKGSGMATPLFIWTALFGPHSEPVGSTGQVKALKVMMVKVSFTPERV